MRVRTIGGRSNAGVLGILVVLLVALPLVVAAIVVQHRQKETSEDRALGFAASQQTANVADYFGRSASLTQILAKNPSFKSFYELPGRRLEKIRGNSVVVRESNEALAHLESLFPGSIGEACFIDAGGAENARAVKGRIESIGNLSQDETKASFFAPTFALRPGQVYQSRPYLSPDTNEWVVANSAPVELPGRATPAIVHFEVTLESLRLAAIALNARFDTQIVDARTGEAVVDTRHAFVGVRRPAGLRARVLPQSALQRQSGVVTLDGHRVAYEQLQSATNNANQWIVVARSKTQAGGWLATISVWQLAIFFVLVALIPLAFLTWRRSQGALVEAAQTDGLTGLGNRRLLARRLEQAAEQASIEQPLLLAMYDLDGFKLYNDTFGHPADDALLTRLAQQLAIALAGTAEAFRMGGDEFCVIAPLTRVEDALNVAALGADALQEQGDGFTVTASYGAVLLPIETREPSDALRLVDQRMYAHKTSARLSAPRQTTDALLQMIVERNPDLGSHASEVASLAQQVGHGLGMTVEQIAELRRAASLHDIGKLAIPESILGKTEPLTAEEWEFIRKHTVIGERILAAAPSLSRTGKIVRATHEAWNGSGYPDSLAGEQIPLEARVIAVCDAYQAMTSERPHAAARTPDEAITELQRCAGTQFNPNIVRTFVTTLTEAAAHAPGS